MTSPSFSPPLIPHPASPIHCIWLSPNPRQEGSLFHFLPLIHGMGHFLKNVPPLLFIKSSIRWSFQIKNELSLNFHHQLQPVTFLVGKVCKLIDKLCFPLLCPTHFLLFYLASFLTFLPSPLLLSGRGQRVMASTFSSCHHHHCYSLAELHQRQMDSLQ